MLHQNSNQLTLNERGKIRKSQAAEELMKEIRKAVDLVVLVYDDNFDKEQEKVSTTGKSVEPIWYIKIAAGKLEGLDEELNVIELGKSSANVAKDSVIKFLNTLNDNSFKKLSEVLDEEQGVGVIRKEKSLLFYLKDDEEAAKKIEF